MKKALLSTVLASSLFFAYSMRCSAEALKADSGNSQITTLENETLSRLSKIKPEEQSDALLHLGKVCFENHDLSRAEKYLAAALKIEEKLARARPRLDLLLNLAIVSAVTGKNEQSADYYKQALKLAQTGKMNEAITVITDSLGTLSFRAGKLDEAEQYFRAAFDSGKNNNNVPLMMNALINQATVQRARKDTKQALSLLNQALALSEKGEVESSFGQAFVNLARVQHDLGNFDESVSAYKKAIEIFKEDVDIESQANASWGLAETFFDLQKISDAREYYQQALDVLKDEPDDKLKLSIMIGMGSAEADLGHAAEAQKLHGRALELAKKLNLPQQELDATLQIGNDFLLNGFPEEGLFKLLKSEKALDAPGIDLAHRGAYLMAIGRCYKTLGQTESAQKYYEEALKLYEDCGDNQSRALALNSLAVLALDNQDKENFDKYYSAAKNIYADRQDKRDLAILDYNYAQYMLITGKYQQAADLYAQALESVHNSGDLVSESMVLRGLGLAQLALGRAEQSMPFYEKALALGEQSGSIEAQWDSQLGLGKCYKKLGQYEQALLHLQKSVELVEKERGKLSRDSFKTYNLDLRNECFVELIDLYIRINKPYDALAIAEKGRARAFLDMLSSRKKSRTVENFQAPLSSHLVPAAGQAAQLVAMAKPEAGTRSVSVMPRASQIYASSAISSESAAAPDVNEIKQLVQNSKSYLVEYYILPDKLACWVIDPDSTIHMVPPLPISKQELTEKVALAYQAITQQPKTQAEVPALSKRRQDALRELNDILIKPLESYLPKNDQDVVTIVPHGPLFMVPFAALISEDKKFLVEKHTLAYIPAIGVFRATQKLLQTVSSEPDKLLAFGNPITKAIAFLGALPYSEKEVHDIADIFGASNSLLKIGQEADKKTFEELAPQFSEIHLATHGLVDEEHPMQSALILAPTSSDDGLLTVKDILAMKELKAKLVVLSACQTGRGKITGDGVVGLSRAFIIAGTPSVLVSQWNVDDIITQFQMKSFYKSYLAHAGRSRSLRQAQLDTIKFMEGADFAKSTNVLRANPRYWAAFQLIGESN